MRDDAVETWVEGAVASSDGPVRRYEVVGPLGRGATGIVEAVEDRWLRRVVARKTLRDSSMLGGFLSEARVTAGLEHPGIVPIYEAHDGDDGPWYTMRRIEGATLAEELAAATPEGRLALLGRFERLCEAVAYVHGQGIVHRDIKPANVMLGSYGEVVVVDFGLAARAGERAVPRAGTPAYMSPEAARGDPPDPRSDVWALGLVLYELLVGRRLLEGDATTVIEQLTQGRIPPLAGLQDVPPELAAVVRKALSVDMAERYPDAEALRVDIADFTAGRLVGAYAYSTGDLLRRFVARARSTLLVVAGALCVVVVVVAVAGWQVAADRDRAVEAERDRTAQLALVLEARARALGDSPRALEAAQEALALDPTLPWARGIVAERAWSRATQDVVRFEHRCQDIHSVGSDRLLARCGGDLLLLDAGTGAELDRTPWGGEGFHAAGSDWVLGLTRGQQIQRASVSNDDRIDVWSRAWHYEGRKTGGWFTWNDEPLELRHDGEEILAVSPEGAVRARAPQASFVPSGAVAGGSGQLLMIGRRGAKHCTGLLEGCRPVSVPGVVQGALWAPDGRRVLVTATSGEAYVYVPSLHALELVGRGNAGGTLDVALLPDGGVAVLSASGRIEVYDPSGSHVVDVDTTGIRPRDITSVGWNVFAAGPGGIARVRLDLSGVRPRYRFGNGIGALAVGPDRLFVAHDHRVYAVRDAKVEPLPELPGFAKDLAVLDGTLVVATSTEGSHRLVDGRWERLDDEGARRTAADGQARVQLLNRGELLVDGRRIASTPVTSDLAVGGGRAAISEGRHIGLYDLQSGAQVEQLPVDGEVWALALSPDGSQLAYALDDHRVRVRDLASGESRVLEGAHRSFVAALAYSPNGRRLASGSWDATSFVWHEGQLEAALEAHDGRVSAVAFASDDVLFTGSWDKTVRRWDLTAWHEVL